MGMHITKRDAAIILFKALSIYSFILALAYFANRFHSIFSFENTQNKMTTIETITPIIILMIGGLIMWWLSPVLASSMFKSRGPDEKYEFTAYDIQVIAFSMIGLLILVNTLPVLVDTLILEYIYAPYVRGNNLMIVRRNSHLFSLFLKISLGVWLLLGSRSIVKFLRRKNLG